MSATDPMPAPAPRSTTRTVIIAALVLLVTFVAGFLVGAVASRFALLRGGGRHAPVVVNAMINRLDRHLDLDDRQRARIEEILERRHARIIGVVHPEIEAANAEIEQVLRPAQREKFEKLKMRLGLHGHHGGKARKESTR